MARRAAGRRRMPALGSSGGCWAVISRSMTAAAALVAYEVFAGPVHAQSVQTGAAASAWPVGNVPSPDPAAVSEPSFPASPSAPRDAPTVFLEAARRAVVAGRTGEALADLGRAERRLRDRSATASQQESPDNDRAVLDIAVARRALAARDQAGTVRAIDDAVEAVARASAARPPPASDQGVAMVPAE